MAYANEIKAGMLGVKEELFQRHGVVSEAVAEALAEGVALKMDTSIGIGVTGIAGPGGGSEEKPVGTVCFAIFIGGDTLARTGRFLGDREIIRERAAHNVLGFLLRLLEGRKG